MPRNVIIIGSGPAGLTAAIYAARANLKPLCIEGQMMDGMIPGGQLMFTTDVENYPGFPEGVTGPDMMKKFRDQAERFGTELITADVDRVDLSERPYKVYVGDDEYVGHAIIIDPWGKVLAEGGEDPCVVVADLDLERVPAARRRIPALANARAFTAPEPSRSLEVQG